MESFFFMVFLTDCAQFPLMFVGQILVLTGAIDIVCSLAGGVVLEKVNLKFGGKYRSWFLIGPPLVAPLFILQFTKIGNDWTAAGIIMFGFVASHLLFNVVFAASGSMVSRLSQRPEERTVLSASRAQGMSAAGLLFSATAMPMLAFFGAHAGETTGYSLTVGVYALAMILGYWFIFRMTAGKDPYDEADGHPYRKKTGPSVMEIVGLVCRNPPLIFLISVQTFASTSLLIITGMAAYYFTYVAGRPALLSLFILAISIARLIGTFSATWIGIKLGKRKSYWIFLSLAAVGFASGWFAMDAIWVYTLIFCVSTMFVSVASAMNTALFADTVVYGEWKTGKNIRAFTMALMNFPIKLGILVRSGVVTVGLMAIGFEANAAPTTHVIEGIVSIMTLVPAAAYAVAAVIFYFWYRIEEKDVLRMQEEIASIPKIGDK
jgi:GPH family glycoside/pentoside/hexuronide:cation symporter/glucuronide carrier protein